MKPVVAGIVIAAVADEIILGLDKDRISWNGGKFDFDDAAFRAGVKAADPQGKIKVQVIAKGYQTYGEVFEVNEAEKTIEVKLNPPQQPYSAHQ